MRAILKGLTMAAGLAAGGCVSTGPGYGHGDGYDYEHGHGDGGPSPSHSGYGEPGMRFRCESENGRQKFCTVDTRGGVSLVRQLSNTPCLRGRTWDVDRRGVWVAHGCRAEFATGYGDDDFYSGGHGGGYPDDRHAGGLIRCESNDGRSRQCPADTRGGARLVRQLSSSACIEGRSWGFDRGGVWVTQGCRGEFATGGAVPRWTGGHPEHDRGYGRILRCESSDNRERRCEADVRERVVLVRQLSSTPYAEGGNWGWDRHGIWVDRGCRAEFVVH
ncbi:MAG TPA: DUF3011 domain-containing protein [Pseudoxanthomonas sp.]|nr:DUF3011 domain-containing protein [Pseudoxanthomonas sp.]